MAGETEAEKTAKPIEKSLDDDLSEILGLLVGTQTKSGPTGLLVEVEQTPKMRQLAQMQQAAEKLEKRARSIVSKINTVPGRENFLKAMAAYQANEQQREVLVAKRDAALDAAAAATGDAAKKATAEALKIQDQIGRNMVDSRRRLERAGETFSRSLYKIGAYDQAQRVTNLVAEPTQALAQTGPQLLDEFTQTLSKERRRHRRTALHAKEQLKLEDALSKKRRARISAAVGVLRRFSNKTGFDQALKKHESSARLKADFDQKKARWEQAIKATGPNLGLFTAKDKAESAYKKVGAVPNPIDEIVEAVDAIATRLPQGHPRRVGLEAMSANLRVKRMSDDYDKVKVQMAKAADGLTPGSSATTALTMEAGGYTGLPGMKLELTVLAGLSQTVERVRGKKKGDMAWKATFTHSEQLSLNAKVGDVIPNDAQKGALKANLAGGTEFSKARTYDTLEELMVGESAVAMNLLCIGAKADTSKGKKMAATFLQERERLIATAHQAKPNLAQLLSQATGRPVNLTATVPDFHKGPSVTAATKAVMAGGGAAFGFGAQSGHSGMLAGNASYKHKRKEERSYLTVPYLSTVKKDQKIQKLHQMAHPELFSFYSFTDEAMTDVEYGASAVNKLRQIEDDIEEANRVLSDADATIEDKATARDTLERRRKEAWSNLAGLRYEYDQYVAISNEVRLKRIPNTEANRAIQNRALRARKLDPKDTAGFIQAASLQFAVAQRLYLATFSGDNEVPQAATDAMATFADDLETPKLGLTSQQLADKFGFKAEAATAKINSNTVSFGLSGGWKKGGGVLDLTDGADNIADGKKGGASAALSINVEANFEEKWKPGKTEPDKKLTVDFMLGHGGGAIIDDEALTTIVGRILSGTDVIKAFKAKKPGEVAKARLLENECMRAVKSLLKQPFQGPIRLELVQPPGSPTRWVLREAMAFSQTDRSVGARSAVPLGGSGGLVVGFNANNRKRQLMAVERSVSTLSDIGLTFRSNSSSDDVDNDGWKRFKDETKLLDRVLRGLDDELGAKPRMQRKNAVGIDFDAMLRMAAEGKVDGAPVMVDNAGSRSVLAGDLIGLVADLQGGDETEQRAATDFVKAWQERAKVKAKVKPTTAEVSAAEQTLKDALDTVIAKKAAKETRTFVDDFQKPTGFSADEIRQLTIRDLSRRFGQLRAESGAVSKSLRTLRMELLETYTKTPAGPEKATALKNLKQAVALAYAASTIDDLASFEDEADKEKALGHLGAGMDGLLGDKPKVYVNEMIDGELVEDADGQLQLRLVVKKGFAKAVDRKILKSAFDDTVKALSDGTMGSPIGRQFSLDRVEIERDGDDDAMPRRKWALKMADSDEQDKAFQKLADKQIPARWNTTRAGRRKALRRSYGRRNHADILKAIAVVLEQEKQAKRRPGTSAVGAKATK
jgi:hypothetical protein